MGRASATWDELTQLSRTTVIFAAFTLWIAYLAALAIYRLYFHPLAKFPGPKLAAVSKFYEMYYEVALRGQFTFHFKELHEKYGPIVRITPYEIHIKDSYYWETLYTKPKSDRYDWMNGRFGNDTSVFTTSDHALHRIRRGALNPMFSRRTVNEFEPFVRQMVEDLMRKFAKYHDEDNPLAINRAWSAYAGDVVTQYSFGFNYHSVDIEDFREPFNDAFIAVSEFGHIALQYPWITPLLNSLPDDLVKKMNPPLEKLLQLQRDLRTTIRKIGVSGPTSEKLPEHATIFHHILASDLHPSEKSPVRLADEAQTVIGAGLTTTAWSLTNAVFFIAGSPRIQDTLRAELRAAIPNPNAEDALSFQKLEKLPYLRACIQEATRFAHGLSGRGPRVFSTPMVYDKWTIPEKTAISMTIADLHFDPEIYPEPREFVPERWLNNPKAPDGSSLEKYFVAFGKGPRSCLGINLAYMELYIALGSLFRRFSLELFETDRSDIEVAHDFFLPSPRMDSLGVRVKFKEVEPGWR